MHGAIPVFMVCTETGTGRAVVTFPQAVFINSTGQAGL